MEMMCYGITPISDHFWHILHIFALCGHFNMCCQDLSSDIVLFYASVKLPVISSTIICYEYVEEQHWA